jgi:hypothetical protein
MHGLLERIRVMPEQVDDDMRRIVDTGPEDGRFGRASVGLRGHGRPNLVAPFKAAIDSVIGE